MNADTAIVESSREMATLSAQGVTALGLHLAQMGQIVSHGSSREAIQKIKAEHRKHESFLKSFKDQRRMLEDQLSDEQERMVEWRRKRGVGQGGSLLDELRILQKRNEELEELLGKEKDLLAGERIFRVRLEAMQERSQEKVKEMVKMWMSDNASKLLPIVVQLWKRYTDSETKFRVNEVNTEGALLIERHRKMRKDCCIRVLDTIKASRARRVASMCFLAWQEELVERRYERLHDELTRRFDNEMFIMRTVVAQATGDEEKAKELVEEQNQRMNAAILATTEAKRERDEARQAELHMSEQKALVEHKISVVLGEKAQALKEKHEAELAVESFQQETKNAREETAKMNQNMKKALEEKEDAILDREMYQRKNAKLTASLAELGAESDDDEPEEERAKPWFIDEQGVKKPRPRTRKERMSMSFNETLTARHEMKLQMAAIIDKDFRQEDRIDRLTDLVRQQDHSLYELKSANQKLQGELETELSLHRKRTSQDSHRMEKLTDVVRQKDDDLSELRCANQKLQGDLEATTSSRGNQSSSEARSPEKMMDLARQPNQSLSQIRQANQVLQGNLQKGTNLHRNQSSPEALQPLQNAPLSPRAVAAAEFKALSALANSKGVVHLRPQSALTSKRAVRLRRPQSAACVAAGKENNNCSAPLTVEKPRASSATSRPSSSISKRNPGTLIPYTVDPKRVFHVAWR